ncbi:LuxR C-terminal-related transcriptional regulator [Nonomuraea sp. NPDC050556]|uniref:helix-turn-helix transcriptional regulator n=1 Tax=Nonomuraea sp. NPDC050556 TaxID=3364369 RepID=UPI00378E0203
MNTTVVPDLGGLLSADAERLYHRLLREGVVPVGGEPSPGAEELIEAGAAYLNGNEARLLPVSPPIALRLLLERQHRELADRHSALADSWRQFSVLVAPAASGGDVLLGAEEAAKRAIELRLSARREVRVAVVTSGLPASAPSSEARVRTVYDASYAVWSTGLRAGEEARIRHGVPLDLVHVDDRAAVAGRLLVTDPGLLGALAAWFDLMWADAATVAVTPQRTSLTPGQLRVLRLLAAGRSDTAISREIGTSVRTVHRHVRAVLDVLGVESRFAAGAAAAKRGWI